MDQLYNISTNSEHKLGLGLLGPDLDTFQFPTSCAEIDHEQLLALDDPQSFYLAFPDAGVFGTYDESASRASTAVTPQSECSSKTNLSGRNISPSSDIMSFHDKPNSHDLESIIHDTTQSIISGRHSRAASVTWTQPSSDSTGLNSTLASSRQFPHRPQSFNYRTPQIPQQGGATPPAPSSYFASPNIPQTQPSSATRSPFLSPNMQSPLTPAQNVYIQTTNISPNPSSYFALPQSQPPPPQFIHSQQANAFQLGLQQTQTLRRPLQANLSVNPSANASMINSFFASAAVASQAHPGSMSNSLINNNINSNTTALPHTTGNSSTGYQCFSHGCGGRHFSNWGNLVRHHRERQLRSKTGAKPTCPRCGKGFTRSSARDAHVAGLKCVLGRRRRGQSAAGVTTGTSTTATGTAATSPTDADVTVKVTGVEGEDAANNGRDSKDASEERDLESDSNTGRKTRESSEDAEAAEDDDDDGEDDIDIDMDNDSSALEFSGSDLIHHHHHHHHEHLDLDLDDDATATSYLNPQHLEFS